MAKQNEHGRLIAAAAKAALSPLGCKRLGQSRTWISDHGYWVIVIEFQPSGWSKGTYLNVGAMWLWYKRKGLLFHFGYRVADLVPYENAEQFNPLIEAMGTRAALEVVALREKFKSIESIYKHLLPLATEDGWPVYRAAIAAGLAGDIAVSQQLFDRLASWSTTYDWEAKLKSDSAELAARLPDLEKFRLGVKEIIIACRSLNKLSALDIMIA